jgi:hypothetical protein
MFDRIRSALAARRAAMLEAEALVLRHGSRAEAIANAFAANPLGRAARHRHYAKVAVIARRRYDLFRRLDTATRHDEAA